MATTNTIELNNQLIMACRHNNLELVKKLIKDGANINFRIRRSNCYPIDIAIDECNLDIIKFFVNNNCKISDDIMSRACGSGDLEIVEYFINMGYTVDKETFKWLCYHGHLHIIKYLVSIGYEPTDEAFIEACGYGHLELAEYLHSLGCKDIDNEALQLAEDNDYEKIVTFLKKIKTPINKMNR